MTIKLAFDKSVYFIATHHSSWPVIACCKYQMLLEAKAEPQGNAMLEKEAQVSYNCGSRGTLY